MLSHWVSCWMQDKTNLQNLIKNNNYFKCSLTPFPDKVSSLFRWSRSTSFLFFTCGKWKFVAAFSQAKSLIVNVRRKLTPRVNEVFANVTVVWSKLYDWKHGWAIAYTKHCSFNNCTVSLAFTVWSYWLLVDIFVDCSKPLSLLCS